MKRANARNYGHEVKGYIIANGMTLTCMAAQLAEKYGRSSCMQNLSGKLRRGTFSYTEAVEIADILGYDIVRKGSVDNSRDLRICPSFNERTE